MVHPETGEFIKDQTPKIWLTSAEMGLGHLRAAYPLLGLAGGELLIAGEQETASAAERRQWRLFRQTYESLSRVRRIPGIGLFLYGLLEKAQNISPYYPFRDLSQPSFQVDFVKYLVKKGMGRQLAQKVQEERRPVVTTFYALAIALEEYTDLPVYCVICDADFNRVWVAEDPKQSRIMYFAPCSHAWRRLRQYGVPDERIFVTGFPLPLENIGDPTMNILRRDLAQRLHRLDVTGRFAVVHGAQARNYLGEEWEAFPEGKISLTFAVGGAGAQVEIGAAIIRGLKSHLEEGRIRLNLVAGLRPEVRDYFLQVLREEGLDKLATGQPGADAVEILYADNFPEYFTKFNRLMARTDLLWTKPSELSFYCGLGIPVIIAPPIGPHEVYNQQWLMEIGAGYPQQNPKHCGDWIFELLEEGRFTLMAWNGFLYGRTLGVYKIAEVIRTGKMVREINPLRR